MSSLDSFQSNNGFHFRPAKSTFFIPIVPHESEPVNAWIFLKLIDTAISLLIDCPTRLTVDSSLFFYRPCSMGHVYYLFLQTIFMSSCLLSSFTGYLHEYMFIISINRPHSWVRIPDLFFTGSGFALRKSENRCVKHRLTRRRGATQQIRDNRQR